MKDPNMPYPDRIRPSVTSPTDIKENLKERVSEIQVLIEQGLKTDAFDGHRFTMRFGPELSEAVQREIEEKYRSAGWQCEFHYDQRDPSHPYWVELSI